MHYEVELGLIMGKTVRDLHPEDTKGAMDAIAGMIHLSKVANYIHIPHKYQQIR
jgi:2-keto-4-pentenoate hydratase/2-oxohepta-3-ene-1,7-dioic acid hydratase in catechol pathway